jgi:hypothetical protein
MVKILSPESLGNLKIYPTHFDPFNQLITQPDLLTLRRRLYADAIMNEYIILSLSHILGSNLTTQLLLNEQQLLDDGIIVPFISQPYSSVEEYIDSHVGNFERNRKVYEKFGLFINEESYKRQIFKVFLSGQPIDEKSLDELITLKRDFLANHIKVATTYHPRATENVVFQQGILSDFNPRTSPFKRKLIRYHEFAKNFSSFLYDYFSQMESIDRSLALKLIEKNVGNKKYRNLFFKILLLDYYLGGCSQLDALLGIQQQFVEIYKKKFERGIVPVQKTILMGEIKGRVFNKFLDVMNIRADILDKLDIDGLLSVRKDRTTEKFRTRYHEIIKQRINGIDASISEIGNMEREVAEAIESEASKQLSLYEKFEYSIRALKFASHTIFGISLFASAFSFSLGLYPTIAGIGFRIMDPLLKRYEQNKCNFILLSEKIRKAAI